MSGLVHNHGPEEGRGLDCPERMVDGLLLGACMLPASWTIVDAHQCTRCGHLERGRDGIMAHLKTHDAADHESQRPSDNRTGDPVVHLVRDGRYPHVVTRSMRTPVRQTQVLAEVTCPSCLGAAGEFLGKACS